MLPSPAVFSDGELIGAYKVRSKIGNGGMGTVYLGEHALLGRKAAIKVLNPSVSNDEEVVQRFFNEARAVTQISDPGIVQVFDYGLHTDGSAFIVMELLEGVPLDERIRTLGRMEIGEALQLVRMACTSLAAAHLKGIVHRDLKPENLFIVTDPAVLGGERAKILDFGIAKLSRDDSGTLRTRTGFVMGSPVYMSPEQCRATAEVDPRSDIYSLGCVMFSMLTGRPPFDEASAAELIAAHLREPAPLASKFRPELPPEIDEILDRCLAKHPDDRYSSMVDLAGAIDAALGQPVRTAPVVRGSMPVINTGAIRSSTVTTLSRASGQLTAIERPRRAWLIGIVVAGIAMGAGVVILVQRGASGSEQPAKPPPPPNSVPLALPPADAAVLVDALPPDAAPPLDAAAPVDAGVPDAPTRSIVPHTVIRKPPPAESTHAKPLTGSGSSTRVDRGD